MSAVKYVALLSRIAVVQVTVKNPAETPSSAFMTPRPGEVPRQGSLVERGPYRLNDGTTTVNKFEPVRKVTTRQPDALVKVGAEWGADVTLTGSGPNNDRGVSKIKVGFIQEVTPVRMRVLFKADKTQLVGSQEGQTYLDIADNKDRTIPWYSSRKQFILVGKSGSITANDSPIIPFPAKFDDAKATGTDALFRFVVDVAASTLDTTGGADGDYWQQGIAKWSINFAGSFDGTEAYKWKAPKGRRRHHSRELDDSQLSGPGARRRRP